MTGLIILAGGAASRFNEKPFYKFRGKEMLGVIYNNLAEGFDEVVVSVKQMHAERVSKVVNAEIVLDEYALDTPLVGILSACSNMSSERVFVVPCDVPMIKKDVVEIILSKLNKDAAVPKWEDGQIEPLVAAYKREKIAKGCKEALNAKKMRVRDALDGLDVQYVNTDLLKEIDPELLSFRNVNTKDDLLDLEKKHRRDKL